MRTIQLRRRRGTSLIEAILALTVLSMLLVPLVSLLKASHVLWHKYESGHGDVSSRQEVAFEVNRILAGARRLTSLSDSEIQFQNDSGAKESLYLTGDALVWDRNGVAEIVARELGELRFRIIEKAPGELGQLIEITVSSRDTAAMANAASSLKIWINPGI